MAEDNNKDNKKKKKPWWDNENPFDDFENIDELMKKFAESITNFPDLNELMQNLFKDLENNKNDFLTRKQPLFWGVSLAKGPNNKPVIRKFGNVESLKEGTKIKDQREPLVDIIDSDGTIVIVAELPGVEKEDIKLSATKEYLIISTDTPERKYYKKIYFKNEIEPKSPKAVYKNGVLEVSFKKAGSKTEGSEINIQ